MSRRKFPEAAKQAVEKQDAEMLGQVVEQLRFQLGYDYQRYFDFVHKHSGIDADAYETMLYEADTHLGDNVEYKKAAEDHKQRENNLQKETPSNGPEQQPQQTEQAQKQQQANEEQYIKARNALVRAACEVEEMFTLDELEAFADKKKEHERLSVQKTRKPGNNEERGELMGIDFSLSENHPSVLINGRKYHYGREPQHGQYLVENAEYAKDYWCFDRKEDLQAFLVNLPESAVRGRLKTLYPDWYEVTHEQRSPYMEEDRARLRALMEEKQRAGTAQSFNMDLDGLNGPYAPQEIDSRSPQKGAVSTAHYEYAAKGGLAKENTTVEPSPGYRYERSKDGCDETWDIYGPDGEHLVSIPFWDDATGTEAKASLIARSLNMHGDLVEEAWQAYLHQEQVHSQMETYTIRGEAACFAIIAAAHHRNGIGGAPFDVVLFEDRGQDGSRKVGIVFEENCHCAVLDVGRLAAGDIAFASNSWRGDLYEPGLREAIRDQEEQKRQKLEGELDRNHETTQTSPETVSGEELTTTTERSEATMSENSAEVEKQKPVRELELGNLRAAIWRNDSEKGEYFTATFSRVYNGKDGYKDTKSFREQDLEKLSQLAEGVLEHIRELSQEQGQEKQKSEIRVRSR